MAEQSKTYYGSWDYTLTPVGGIADVMQSQILVLTNSKQIGLKKIDWEVFLNINDAPVFDAIPLEQNNLVLMSLLINGYSGVNIGAILTNVAGTVITNSFALHYHTPGKYYFEKISTFNDLAITVQFDNLDLLNNIRVRTMLSIETIE